MWYYAIYFNATRSSLEIALRSGNAVFLLVINIGAILIYYVVTRLIVEQNKAMTLKESNHRLTMQALQYENLQERISEARRAKHDVRHHISVMQEYLNKKDYGALEEYLNTYQKSLPDDTLVRFCENATCNTVLLYFAQQAKNAGIDYIVEAVIPEGIGIEETDLSVLFGNLLENALEACKAQADGSQKIVTRATADHGSLCITIDNTFHGTLKHQRDGKLVSTKHRGLGLGTESVRCIAEKYKGTCRFETKDGMFYASVICFTAPPHNPA